MLSIPSKPVQWDLQTHDPDHVRSVASRFLTSYRLDTFLNKSYDARLLARKFPSTAISVIEYGDRAGVNTESFETFTAIHMPVRGSFQTGSGKHATSVRQGEAQILYPDIPVKLDCSPDCSILVLRFDNPLILSLMKDIQLNAFQDVSRRPSILSLKQGSGRTFAHLVNLLTEEFSSDGLTRQKPTSINHVEKLLTDCVTTILQERLTGRVCDKSATPAYVRRVERYINQNPNRNVSLDELVPISGVSQRTLIYGFKKTHGVGPISWSRQLRLSRAHTELLASNTDTSSVTDIAYNWGFNHLGRFSEYYLGVYGESPSETLKRRGKG